MGLFDYLFGSRDPEITDPEQLRVALFHAAGRGDRNQVERLSRKHRQTILDHFHQWQKVPVNVRRDKAASQAYFQGVITIVEVFAQRLSCPDLMNQLIGPPETNPLVTWPKALAAAEELMKSLRYQEAIEQLSDLLIDNRQYLGNDADTLRTMTYALLGVGFFQSGQASNALPHLQQALHLSEENANQEGITAYLQSLYEVHRYLGNAEEAAACAERLALHLPRQGDSAEGRRYQTRAKIVRAGEPLNRVLAIIDGVEQEIEELHQVKNQRIQFAFTRNRLVLHPAEELTRRGDELGSQGRFEEALSCFREAAEADPFDPHSHYLAGHSLLHLERYPQAVEEYQTAEELAPGWFQCRSDLWLAQQLALGKVSHEVAVGAFMMADSGLSAEVKVHLGEQLLSRAPDLAPLHLVVGRSLTELGRTSDAIAAFQRGLACAAEPDVKTRLLAELAVATDDLQKRAALLQEAAELNGNLIAAAQAKVILKTLR